jgi:hypothetical protein
MHDKRKENSDDALLLQVAQLLVRESDDALSLRGFHRLRVLLQSNPRAREHYYHILMTMADLKPISFSPAGNNHVDKPGTVTSLDNIKVQGRPAGRPGA